MLMKRTALATTLTLAFLISVVAGVHTVKAQHTPDGKAFPLASPIKIISPSNSTYSPNSLILNVTSRVIFNPDYANLSYSIDGKNNATLPITITFVPIEATIIYANGTETTGTSMFSPYEITGWVALPELPEGPHNITVYAKYQANNIIGLDSSTVHFTIDDGKPPIISDLSLENKTYNSAEMPLSFNIDQTVSWMAYCLDNQANTTITGNTTLNELADGSHSLVVYANDTAANSGASETVTFTVDTTEPFSTTQVVAVASGTSLAVISVGLLIYFKKRKH